MNLVTGEVIDPDDPVALADAIQSMRDAKWTLDNEITNLSGAVARLMEKAGSKTLTLKDGRKLVGGPTHERVFDIARMKRMLMEAGLPLDRLAELVKVKTEEVVDNRVLISVAAANTKYRRAIEDNVTHVLKRPYVSIKS